MVDVTHKRAWTLTQTAFDKLLAVLDANREHAGEKYEELRLRLVSFFEWRGSISPDEHADEVLNRVAQKIDEGTEIQHLQSYCYGIARLLLLDSLKDQEKKQAMLVGLSEPTQDAAEADDSDAELQYKCFEECLQKLSAENRKLIIDYYQDEEHPKIDARKNLAESLGVPLNALRIRACRIRAKLEGCVAACVSCDGKRK